MDKKFALITDDKTFSTDSGYKIITYNSAWDSMGWTALKELSLQAAEGIAETLAVEGYVICWGRDALQRAVADQRQIERERYEARMRS